MFAIVFSGVRFLIVANDSNSELSFKRYSVFKKKKSVLMWTKS